MKIFIAGCARSGTTLTLRLMNCFADTRVLPHEASARRFLWTGRTVANTVIKRTGKCYRSLPRLSSGISLIYCIRHPFDVLTSSHPGTLHLRRYHVTAERWLGEYEALCKLRATQPQRQIFFVKYEDLVRNPDSVQHRMEEAFALHSRRRFSADPGEAIFVTSVEKWVEDPNLLDTLRAICLPIEDALARFNSEFGYQLPNLSSAA